MRWAHWHQGYGRRHLLSRGFVVRVRTRNRMGFLLVCAVASIVALMALYLTWIWHDTRCVMDELRATAASEPYEWNDVFQDVNYELQPFLPFQNGPDDATETIDSITRHFVWAWGDKGFILVRKQATRTDGVSGSIAYSEELRIDIERDQNGKWSIVAWSSLH